MSKPTTPKLTRTAIRDWLFQQPDDRMFQCGNPRHCIVAEYLHENGFPFSEVTHYWYPQGGAFNYEDDPEENPEPRRRLPPAIHNLMKEFDRLYKKNPNNRTMVTAAEVKQHLFAAR